MEHETRHYWYRGEQYRKEHRHKETSGNDKWYNNIRQGDMEWAGVGSSNSVVQGSSWKGDIWGGTGLLKGARNRRPLSRRSWTGFEKLRGGQELEDLVRAVGQRGSWRSARFFCTAPWEAGCSPPYFFLPQQLYPRAMVVVGSCQRFGKCQMESDMVRERTYNGNLKLLFWKVLHSSSPSIPPLALLSPLCLVTPMLLAHLLLFPYLSIRQCLINTLVLDHFVCLKIYVVHLQQYGKLIEALKL